MKKLLPILIFTLLGNSGALCALPHPAPAVPPRKIIQFKSFAQIKADIYDVINAFSKIANSKTTEKLAASVLHSIAIGHSLKKAVNAYQKYTEYTGYKSLRADPTDDPEAAPPTFAEMAPARNRFLLKSVPLALSLLASYAEYKDHPFANFNFLLFMDAIKKFYIPQSSNPILKKINAKTFNSILPFTAPFSQILSGATSDVQCMVFTGWYTWNCLKKYVLWRPKPNLPEEPAILVTHLRNTFLLNATGCAIGALAHTYRSQLQSSWFKYVPGLIATTFPGIHAFRALQEARQEYNAYGMCLPETKIKACALNALTALQAYLTYKRPL